MFFKIKFFSFCSKIDYASLEKDFLKLDYYSLLHLKKNITNEQDVKRSYIKLAKKFHPDVYKGSPELFKRITEAYKTLKDPFKREEYNKKMNIIKNQHYKRGQSKKAEKMAEYPKFEEEFKKLDINKLFLKFTNRRVRHSAEEIKVTNTLFSHSKDLLKGK